MSALKPPVRVTVDNHVTDGEGTTRYCLHVATHRCEWDILKRYSEVDALKKALLPKFVSVRSSELFFPPKKVKSDPKVIRERQELFQTWFAAIFSDVHVVRDASVIHFLQLNNLRRAVSAGDDRYIELLHSAGAPLTHDPNDADLLPLHHVCKRGFAACAEVILRSVDPKVRLELMLKLDAEGFRRLVLPDLRRSFRRPQQHAKHPTMLTIPTPPPIESDKIKTNDDELDSGTTGVNGVIKKFESVTIVFALLAMLC